MGKRVQDSGFLTPENVKMFGRRAVREWHASVMNNRTYRNWYNLFFNAMLSRFEWSGLPSGIDARYLEVIITQWGCCGFTKMTSRLEKYWVGTIANQKQLDAYTNPQEIRIMGAQGFQQVRHCTLWKDETGQVQAPNAVVCWDNMMRLPIYDYIDTMCNRISELDTTIDQHTRAQRVPYVVYVDEEGRKNASELFRKVANGDPAIYVNNSNLSGTPSLGVLPTANTTNYNGTALIADQGKLVSQVYTRLGIDNDAQSDKRERVQTAETLSNNEQIMIQRRSYLKPRQMFCDEVNDMFGLNLSVKWGIPHVEESNMTFPGSNVESVSTSVYNQGDDATQQTGLGL